MDLYSENNLMNTMYVEKIFQEMFFCVFKSSLFAEIYYQFSN